MPKIEIEVDDISTLFCGLNNAIILYGDDIRARNLYCESNLTVSEIPLEKCKLRYAELRKFYDKVYEKYKSEIEKEK